MTPGLFREDSNSRIHNLDDLVGVPLRECCQRYRGKKRVLVTANMMLAKSATQPDGYTQQRVPIRFSWV
jgi:hypothetical protein